MAVQRLGLWAFTAKGMGSIPGQGSEILQAMWHGKEKSEKLHGVTHYVCSTGRGHRWEGQRMKPEE